LKKIYLDQLDKKRKRKRKIEKVIKLSLFPDDMILYMEKSQRFHNIKNRYNKLIQQSCRIQDQYMKTICTFIHNNKQSIKEKE
jgi:hypothetical protein